MSQKFEKLKTLLKELFQLDQPDLDFGLYRVMHAKSAEVSQFLDKALLPQVKAAFGQYKTADKAEIEGELAKVIAGVEAAGMDPAQSPKVADLRARLRKRRYKAAFVAKLSDAESEACETQTWIEFALRCGYMESDRAKELDTQYEHILSQLVTVINQADRWIVKTKGSKD